MLVKISFLKLVIRVCRSGERGVDLEASTEK